MDFFEIDAARQRAGMTILELSRRAEIAPSTYWFIRKRKVRPSPRTLARYAEALRGEKRDRPCSSMLLAYRGHLAMIASKLGFDPVQVVAAPNARRFWQARCLAIYCTSIEQGVGASDLGRALGLSKQVVSWNLKQARDLVDNPTLAAAVSGAQQVISGRAADDPFLMSRGIDEEFARKGGGIGPRCAREVSRNDRRRRKRQSRAVTDEDRGPRADDIRRARRRTRSRFSQEQRG